MGNRGSGPKLRPALTLDYAGADPTTTLSYYTNAGCRKTSKTSAATSYRPNDGMI